MVGRPRRISEHRRLQIGRGEAVPDRERKQVDYLVYVRPDEMGAEHQVRVLFDQDLEAVDRFRGLPCGEPAARLSAVRSKLAALRARLFFRQSHCGGRRKRESDARHAPVVGAGVVALEQIGRDDLSVVTRDRRQGRPHLCHVSRRLHGRVRHAPQELVQLEAAVPDVDPSRFQSQSVKIRRPVRRMDDQIRIDSALHSVRRRSPQR